MSVEEITETKNYLTFTLNSELFAIEIINVREVLDITKMTKVPRTPDFMPGVINLRGSVVAVIDLRKKFGMNKPAQKTDPCIIIIEIKHDNESIVLGALADSVQEVVALEPDVIEPAPNFGIQLNTEFIMGMGRRDNHFIIILDTQKVFSLEELTAFTETNCEEVPVRKLEDKPKCEN
ncbi:MAG: chemotaxis protein CheW [bacterium]